MTENNLFYSAEECRSSLMRFGVRDLTPAAIAQALSVMAKTPQVNIFVCYPPKQKHMLLPFAIQ